MALGEYLLQQGANVHIRDRLGESALWFAIREKHADIIKLLMKAGAHFSQEELVGIRSKIVWFVFVIRIGN